MHFNLNLEASVPLVLNKIVSREIKNLTVKEYVNYSRNHLRAH